MRNKLCTLLLLSIQNLLNMLVNPQCHLDRLLTLYPISSLVVVVQLLLPSKLFPYVCTFILPSRSYYRYYFLIMVDPQVHGLPCFYFIQKISYKLYGNDCSSCSLITTYTTLFGERSVVKI